MAAVRTQILIEKCADCPFFERGAVSVIADALTKRGTRSGACKFHGLGIPFPQGRTPVSDENTIPGQCPLKFGDCVISLKVLPS